MISLVCVYWMVIEMETEMTNTDPMFIHLDGDSVTIKPRADGAFRAEYRRKDVLAIVIFFAKLGEAKADAREWLGNGAGEWKRIGPCGHVYSD